MKMTSVYKDTAYPNVSAHMDKNRRKYENHVKGFIKDRIEYLNDIGPYNRITHTDKEKAKFWADTGFKEKDFKSYISDTYYGNKSIKPVAAKDPLTIALIHIVRYYYIKKDKKNLEMAMIHLSFSGKLYPSVHYNSFPIIPYKHIMDFVINNKLNYKYDIKKHGTILKSIQSLNDTWLDAYHDLFTSWLDEDVVYLLDQLIDRMRSFMKNIATVYYEAHKNEEYLSYSSDNLDDDDYRLADSNSLKSERIITNTMTYLTTNKVNYTICKNASNTNVRVHEVKSLLETILSNNENIPLIRELITIIVTEFFVDKPSGTVRSAEFIVYSIKPRPNTSNKMIIRMKEIQYELLAQSDDYLKRMKRAPTKASYVKSLQTYFTYAIYNANRTM